MVRTPVVFRVLRRAVPVAWEQLVLAQPTRIAGCVTIAALNILWQGHGVLRSSPIPIRFFVVGLYCYVVTTVSEFLWLLVTGPRFTGFESPTGGESAGKMDTAEHIAADLKTLPAAELHVEWMELTDGRKRFVAAGDCEVHKSH